MGEGWAGLGWAGAAAGENEPVVECSRPSSGGQAILGCFVEMASGGGWLAIQGGGHGNSFA